MNRGAGPCDRENALLESGVGVGGRSVAAHKLAQDGGLRTEAVSAACDWRGFEPAPVHKLYPYLLGAGRGRYEPRIEDAFKLARRAAFSVEDPWMSAWLSMVDEGGAGTYDTYAGLDCHKALTTAETSSLTTKYRDDLFVAVLASVAMHEVEAVEVGTIGADLKGVQRRVSALVAVLARLKGAAPESSAWQCTPITMAAAAQTSTTDKLEQRVRAARTEAERLRGAISADLVSRVDLTLLPVTSLHDELMFIRLIQAFEILYEHVLDAVRTARDLVMAQPARVSEAAASLRAVSMRVGSCHALFRILSTMPPQVFAVIRDRTQGRSAVQSKTYRRIETISSGAVAPPRTGLWSKSQAEVTLQDAFQRFGLDSSQLANEMGRLDAAWVKMKRTHWGIAVRMIGDLPGTGGTTGSAYLQTAAERQLFPALAR